MTEAAPADKEQRRYEQNVAKALNRVYESDATEEQEIELDTARIVVFSDHHKGARDGADDFFRCERAYAGALGYYLEQDFRLFVLGDVEELWECTPEEVTESYREVLQLEAKYHRAGRYERFWGNHDDQWSDSKHVAKHLGATFPGLRVRQALKVHVVRGGERVGLLFFVHGHQGTLDSDRYKWFSRQFVRHIWRPAQRRLNMASTTPARNFVLRARHDAAMFRWARGHPDRPVVVSGHTHRPVFWDSRPPVPPVSDKALSGELEELRAAKAEKKKLAELRARIEFNRAEAREKGPPPIEIKPPCYFNTGCCSFGDGDITGIEIADGHIRLVRWPDDNDEPKGKLLVEEPLAKVLDHVATGATGAR